MWMARMSVHRSRGESVDHRCSGACGQLSPIALGRLTAEHGVLSTIARFDPSPGSLWIPAESTQIHAAVGHLDAFGHQPRHLLGSEVAGSPAVGTNDSMPRS